MDNDLEPIEGFSKKSSAIIIKNFKEDANRIGLIEELDNDELPEYLNIESFVLGWACARGYSEDECSAIAQHINYLLAYEQAEKYFAESEE